MQFLFLRTIKVHMIFLLTSVVLFITGCEEDDHAHDEDHTEAAGFKLEDETGTQVYKQLEGTVEGTISLAAGDTLELTVHFLDEDGDEIEHEEEEEEEEHEDEINVSGFDENIAIVEAEAHEEEGNHNHEEEEHGMAIHIIGVATGSTSFKLELMHEDHADYSSTSNVPVIVN